MHNVLFDISVFVSALITNSKPNELWVKAVTKEFNLIASREILSEFTSTKQETFVQFYDYREKYQEKRRS